MGRMIPVLSESQLNALDSQAEAKVYRACRDQLPGRVVVLHRAEWILRREGEGATDGEADFLLCDPDTGLVTLEIKGGGIRFDPAADTWSSIDAARSEHPIKDPFRQAKNAKFAVLGKLREHRRWPQCGVGKILLGHAVLFPDVNDLEPLCQARIPREIVGGHGAIWGVRPLVGAFASLLARPGQGPCTPRAEVVGACGGNLRQARRCAAARCGAAGRRRAEPHPPHQPAGARTGVAGRAPPCGHLRRRRHGKTLLAVEKSKRLACEGFRTLLLCFNRPLGDHLVKVCHGILGLEVASFHSLCGQRCTRVKELAGRDLLREAAAEYPAGDLYDVQMPAALAYSVDVLEDHYDAVVVDEGQDFKDEFWFPIELMLTDENKSPLYIFYDQNQALYNKASAFPVHDEPYVLTNNCRNTRVIHGLSYRYFRGDATEPPEIDGLPVEVIAAPTVSAQACRGSGLRPLPD